MLPTSSPGNRRLLIIWAIAALVGTVAVFWLRGYLEGLVTLAETDREAALDLFRSRALPALVGIVAIAVGAGALLMRMGLQAVNAPRPQLNEDRSREAHPSRMVGWMMAGAGFVLAAVPLVLISMVFWMLRRG